MMQDLVREIRVELDEERLKRKALELKLKLAEQRLETLQKEISNLKNYVEEVAKEASKPRYIIHRRRVY